MDLTLRLNARLQPIHQFQFEDVIHTLLTKKGIGETSGGGVAQDPEGETTYCEIEIHLDDTKPNNNIQLLEILSKTGIPKGSTLWSADPEFNIEVGTLEGLAYYFNNTELPYSIYETCDVNYALEQMEKAIEGIGKLYSYWKGRAYTALYFYGHSFFEMKQKIEAFNATYPLCQKSRIEQIA